MNHSPSIARDIVDGLMAGGVRHVVLAPGSRSAPLAYEVQAADRAGRLVMHVRVDERAAGFLAVGLAKLSRQPVAVVTTSGTAVANLHPAVLEAHHGLVPLIVLSADRPRELRGIGANQTTIQPGMFGETLRWEAELTAEDEVADRCRVIAEAVRAARCGGEGTGGSAGIDLAGPVHVNVALREPLVPDLDAPPRAGWPTERVGGDVPTRPVERFPLTLPERTLVILGDLPGPSDARTLATALGRLGLPVVAEPFGEHPLGPTVLPHGPLLLGTSWFTENPPERIVVAGRVTLSRSVRAALTATPERVTYLGVGPRWLGPSYPVGEQISGGAALLAPRLVEGADPSEWLSSWRAASKAVAEAISPSLQWGTGPGLAAGLVAALPPDSTLMLGSSNSVRDLDLSADWTVVDTIRVVANRGLAGIDGVVSTAVGLALSGAGPTYALVGDLTFLHDVNALLIGPDEPRPDLTVIVANDDGGGIFSTLEPGEAERADDFERIFGTATGARIEDLAHAYGARYARAGSPEELSTLVRERPSGLRVVEVVLDRSRHRLLRDHLRALAESATGSLRRAGT